MKLTLNAPESPVSWNTGGATSDLVKPVVQMIESYSLASIRTMNTGIVEPLLVTQCGVNQPMAGFQVHYNKRVSTRESEGAKVTWIAV